MFVCAEKPRLNSRSLARGELWRGLMCHWPTRANDSLRPTLFALMLQYRETKVVFGVGEIATTCVGDALRQHGRFGVR